MSTSLTANFRALRAANRYRQRGKMGKSIVALLGLAILGASGTAITYLITQQGGASAAQAATQAQVTPATKPVPSPTPIFVELEPFTVTLTQQGMERMLHVGLTLKVDDEQSKARITDYLPVVRSRLLMLMSSQDIDTIQTLNGKRDLAAQVREAVSAPLAPGSVQHISDVLFTAFVVQ